MKIKSLLLGLLWTGASVYAQQKPNIIYIYADDLGYGELGSYGQKLIETPNLDQLASEGIRFTQHYSSSPVCAPARAMLLTGKHAGHAYIRGNYELGGFADAAERGQMPLPEGTITWAKLLKAKGYQTAIIGKWGLGMHNTSGSPNKQGFDYAYGYLDQKQAHNYYPTHLWENGQWDSLDNPVMQMHQNTQKLAERDQLFSIYEGREYAVDKLTEKALAFIQDNKEKPFMIYLPYTIPHVGLQAPKEWVEKYKHKFKAEKPYYGTNGYNPSQFPLATYAAMISYLDAQVGLIMQQLSKLGIAENTLLLFSSDNGPTFNGGVDAELFQSTSGLRGLKTDVYEGGIRVPFLARWPKHIAAGTVSDLPSVQYDVLATLDELTGDAKQVSDGVSFLPTLLGRQQDQKKREFIYFEFPEKGGQLAIRLGDWKGVKLNLKKDPKSKWQLFNLAQDPSEQQDLALLYPEILKRMDQIVAQEHQPAHLLDWQLLLQ